MTLLELKEVSVSYQGKKAVQKVSFLVESGDYICIVGYNGSGKSTLVKAMLGLVPLQHGKIERMLPKEQIAYLPQSSAIPPDLPAIVFEIVMTGNQKRGRKIPFYSKEEKIRARQAMEQMEIAHCARKNINQLSGGQRQRALIARALCGNPKMLILDEPCAGLDEAASQKLYQLLRELNRSKGVAILMVSHDLEEVAHHRGKVLELNRELKFYGSAENWQKQRGGGTR